ncbi:hypothetical protein [Xanthomonas euvesicatoria]|uniref:hypothetical protein n=1 Tax=Xanthomonas euvesicatoria TaxID=456327 RepID=UPI001E2F048B|nr:hypothetical protein [Xanthomonas euvesicatoria]
MGLAQLSLLLLSLRLQPFFFRRVQLMFGPADVLGRQPHAMEWPLWLPGCRLLFTRSLSGGPFERLFARPKCPRLHTIMLRRALWPMLR